MAKQRMVLEIGMGTDIRGADPTKAACRALRDALWHNSLSIAAALGQTPEGKVTVKAVNAGRLRTRRPGPPRQGSLRYLGKGWRRRMGVEPT